MLFGHREINLRMPCVMGVLNVTPDSFSDGGRFASIDAARHHAAKMVEDGAAIIDVGGESTRPGANPVSVVEELDRVCPIIEAITSELDVVVSIDTSTPEVMREAARLGAGLINDVRALSRPGALIAAVETGLPVCLMHMQGEPGVMQQNPHYDDVVSEVRSYLAQRVAECVAAGIPPEKLLLDPGFGFGKTLEHNLQLLRELEQLTSMGFPVLVGMSRKAMIGNVLNKQVDSRAVGSAVAAAIAVLKGAAVVRVHDVRETVDAIKMAAAIRGV